MIDAHVHFWDPAARRYAWLDGVTALRRRFGPEDYNSGAHPVKGMVFVQADCREEEALSEVRWVAGLADQDPRIWGIVAHAPVHRGSAAAAAVAAVAAERRVVGVRRLLQDEPETVLRDPVLAEGLRLLSEHSLPFDLCVRHHQLSAVRVLVEACPEVTFVLDHLGKPAVAAACLDPWREDIARLAASRNVYCKLSGLATEAAPGWHPEDLRPYLEHALDVFGPRRCMAGSDWPVSNLATTAEAWFDLVMEIVAGLSEEEREAVLEGTASSVYQLRASA